jgi:hypothetical protein
MTIYQRQHADGTEMVMTDKPQDKYAVRWVTSPNAKSELYIVHYEIVDIALGLKHSSDQVIYRTKSKDEADMYCRMMNTQDELERN